MKLNESVKDPLKATEGSVGFDISSDADIVIPPMTRRAVQTGLKLIWPKNHYGQLISRSGLSLNKGIDVVSGILDKDYCGEIKVILFNSTKEEFLVNKGDRIAQLLVKYEPQIDIINKNKHDITMPQTFRGEQGFGSTGV